MENKIYGIYGINNNGEVYVYVHELRKKFSEKYEGWAILLDRPDAVVGEPGTYVCTGKVVDTDDKLRATWHQLARATAATAEAGGDPYMDCQSLCELHLLKQMLPELTVTEEISNTVKKELGIGIAPITVPSAETEEVPDVDMVVSETSAPAAPLKKKRGRPAAVETEAPVTKPVKVETEAPAKETSAEPEAPVEDKKTETASMTKEEAEAVICTYNKCKGKTMKEVKEEAPNIFAWFVKAGAQAAAKFPKETEAAQILNAE